MTGSELNAARDLVKAIRAGESDLATLRLTATKLVPIRDGMPKAERQESRVEEIALMIIEGERELAQMKERLVEVTGELARKLSRIALTPQERRVIFLRYVACSNFRDIAFEMDLSDARVYFIHATARDKIVPPLIDTDTTISCH